MITGDDAVSVAENTSISTVIATYMATDTDANTTFMWTLEGTDAGDFDITTNSSGDGDLRFNSEPNFESKHVYNVTVKVEDDESPLLGRHASRSPSPSQNVNEAPASRLHLYASRTTRTRAVSDTHRQL